MPHIDVIAGGRLRDNALLSLWQDYVRRLQWPTSLHEIDVKKPAEEEQKFLDRIDPQAYVFALDERGKSLGSVAFAHKIDDISAGGISKFQFIIGSADGLPESVRKKADFLLSFGNQTWPHMLVRIMLVEQIYRAQQIMTGHPYHRE